MTKMDIHVFAYIYQKNNPIYKNKKRIAYPYKTHRAVASLFVTNKNPNENELVMHKNDIRDCNIYLNLKWGTSKENMDDKFYSGKSKYLIGAEKSESLFSEKDAKDICHVIYDLNITKKSEIIKYLGYQDRNEIFLKSYGNLIQNIKRGHCWRYIRDQYI